MQTIKQKKKNAKNELKKENNEKAILFMVRKINLGVSILSKVDPKNIETESVFTKTKINNEWNTSHSAVLLKKSKAS